MKYIFGKVSILLAALLLLGSFPAWAQNATPAVKVGNIEVGLTGPEGLKRVDGLNPRADAYIKSLEPKFKFKVLALYAEPKEWNKFVADAEAGRPSSIPRFAMIGVPSRMAKKSYDFKKIRKEFKKYDNWFSLAANNRATAALLTAQGNKKLKEFLGVDINFKFRSGNFTRKFSETTNSISMGALVGFNVHKRASDVYLTATSLAVGDKLVFMAYFDQSGPPAELTEIQARSLLWRAKMSDLNAGQYRKK